MALRSAWHRPLGSITKLPGSVAERQTEYGAAAQSAAAASLTACRQKRWDSVMGAALDMAAWKGSHTWQRARPGFMRTAAAPGEQQKQDHRRRWALRADGHDEGSADPLQVLCSALRTPGIGGSHSMQAARQRRKREQTPCTRGNRRHVEGTCYVLDRTVAWPLR